MLTEGCSFKHCTRAHTKLADLAAKFKERLTQCKTDVDAGWGGIKVAANERRSKSTPAADEG